MRHLALIAALAPVLAVSVCAAQETHDMAGQDMFEQADANHDGSLARQEHAAFAQMMFGHMDTDHDGQASAAEMQAQHAAMGGHHMQHMDHADAGKAAAGQPPSAGASGMGGMMAKWDSNSDGQLSASEHAAMADAMFDRMDGDHDGSLTRAEFDMGHASMMRGMMDGHAMPGHGMQHGAMHDAMHGDATTPAGSEPAQDSAAGEHDDHH